MEATMVKEKTKLSSTDHQPIVISSSDDIEQPKGVVESEEAKLPIDIVGPEDFFVTDNKGETAEEIMESALEEEEERPKPPSIPDTELDDDVSLSVPLITASPVGLRTYQTFFPEIEEAVGEINEDVSDEVLDICVICREPVPQTGEFTLTTGCCGTRHHLTCLLGSNWLPSNKAITCPMCSRPDDIPSIEERTEMVKQTYLKEHGLRKREAIDKELISSLYNHMLRNAASGGFRAGFNMWLSGDVSHGFQFMAENGITLDDLMSLNFGLDTIKRHVATSFAQLISIGFAPGHLKRLENQLSELIALYGVNIHKLRSTLGNTAFTVSKIIDLNLGAHAMESLGITTHQLCLMGMTKIRIPEFKNVSMQEWVNVLGLRKSHIRLLRIKQADFSRILKPVHWNYIGLKHLLKISDEEAASLGMTDALNKYTSSSSRNGSRNSSRSSSPVRGDESAKGRYKGKGRGRGRGKPFKNRRTRRNSFKQFETDVPGRFQNGRGGPPRVSLGRDAAAPAEIPYPPEVWTHGPAMAPVYGVPVQTPSNPHRMPYALGGTTYFTPLSHGYQNRYLPSRYPPSPSHGRAHTGYRKDAASPLTEQTRGGSVTSSASTKPRFTGGRPPVTHKLKKQLNDERKTTRKLKTTSMAGVDSTGAVTKM